MKLNNLQETISFINSNKICFLYFNKENTTCCVCNVVYSKLLKLKKFYNIEIGLVLDNTDIFNHFEVYSTPFTIMFAGGKEVLKEGAYLSIDEVETKLNRLNTFI